MQTAAQKALETLHGVIDDDEARPSDKVAAARILLDHAHRAADALDVQGRIAALEEALEARRGRIQ